MSSPTIVSLGVNRRGQSKRQRPQTAGQPQQPELLARPGPRLRQQEIFHHPARHAGRGLDRSERDHVTDALGAQHGVPAL